MARGSIRKRGDAWTLSVALGRDPATGKYNRKYETVHGTKRDAEKRLTELLAELDRGQLGISGKMTLSEYLDYWLSQHVQPNLAPGTYRVYRKAIRYHIAPKLGHIRLDRLKSQQVLAWLHSLRDAPKLTRKDETISAGSVRSTYSVLNNALATAVRWNLLPVNPCAKVGPPGYHPPEMHALSPDEARRLLAATDPDDPYWRAFFTLMITTGLRLGEISGLRWVDVDLAAGALTIARSYWKGIVRPPKTAGSRRRVTLGDDVVQLLRRHKALQNEARLALGGAWHNLDLVFGTENGNYLSQYLVRKELNATLTRAGLPRVRIHDLRHTAATLLMEAGIPPKVIAERLGHSSVAITMNLYSHVSPTLQQQAATTMDTLLKDRNAETS